MISCFWCNATTVHETSIISIYVFLVSKKTIYPARCSYNNNLIQCWELIRKELINWIRLVWACKWYTFHKTLHDEDHRRDRRRHFAATTYHTILYDIRALYTSFSLMTTFYTQFKWTDNAHTTTIVNTNSNDDAYTRHARVCYHIKIIHAHAHTRLYPYTTRTSTCPQHRQPMELIVYI